MKRIYEQVKDLVFKPKQTWETINGETKTEQQLVISHLMPLAAIPAVAFFIGYSILGVRIPFAGVYRMAWWQSLLTALIGYVVTVATVWLLGFIISQIAPWFGASQNRESGLKLSVFSYSPYLFAGVLYIIPNLGIVVTLVGIYGLYLLYLGVDRVMHPPENKTVLYSVSAVIIALVLHVVLSQITFFVLGLFGPDLPNV